MTSSEVEGQVSREFDGLYLDRSLGFLNEEPPPPPPMFPSAEGGIVSFDITKEFRDAAATLKPGELVKDGYFTLFDAVGALEIMDSKMDSGRLEPGESLYADYDVTRPLSPNEVLGIIDQLLSLEMAWHLGYPLSQTVFTSVYVEAILMPTPTTIEEADFVRVHKPGEERDPMLQVLRAYCLGLLKTCYFVNESTKLEHFHEEEDFVTNTYNRSLLDKIDVEDIRDVISEAKQLLFRLRHKMSNEVTYALEFRLQLRTAFLRAIELSELRSNAESLSLPWVQMAAVWEQINKSRHLGTPMPDTFSTKIQRRLASTMPPRPIVQLSPEETHRHFKKFFEDGANVLKILNYSDPQSLLNFVLNFQAQKPQPLVYIRTLLQFFLFKDLVILGHLSARQLIDDDLSVVSLPSSKLLDPANDAVEHPLHPVHTLAHHMDVFRQRATQSYLDIFRAVCQNRCRVRRTLFHLVQDWETVQQDAEEMDALIQILLHDPPSASRASVASFLPEVKFELDFTLPLSSWAYLYKLRLMEWIVQLGFELEIYQPDELAGMYWYLHFLAKARLHHVTRVENYIKDRVDAMRLAGHKMTKATEFQLTRSLSYLKTTKLDASTTSALAESLSLLYAALERLSLVTRPSRPYSNDALRYDIRMKPFSGIMIPTLPSVEQYTTNSTRPDLSTEELLAQAEAASNVARGGFDSLANLNEKEAFAVSCFDLWMAGTRNGSRSVIATQLAISAARKAIGREGEARELLAAEVRKPDAGYHEWWIVPKVLEQK